jgi:hypothetical protein
VRAQQSVCTNGRASTCDAAGNVISSEVCIYGCFEDQPRCREIAPSNGLAHYLDLVPNPPDLYLENASIDTGTGTITTAAGNVMAPQFSAPNGDGPTIRVFIARSVRLKNVSLYSAIEGPRPRLRTGLRHHRAWQDRCRGSNQSDRYGRRHKDNGLQWWIRLLLRD